MREILIIRSCHMMQFFSACESLRKRYADVKITAVTQAVSAEVLLESGLVDDVITVEKSSPWKVSALTAAEKKSLKQKCYDIFVIPYNNHSGVRYRNVERFVSFVHTDNVMMSMTDGKSHIFSLKKWYVRCASQMALAVADKIMFASLAVLFFFSFVLFFCFKKFFAGKENRITFFSPQNFNYPSARVRCYDFAKILGDEGYIADVIGYDNLLKVRGESDPIPEEMLDSRKLFVSLVEFFKLIFTNKSSVYVLQKIKYNAIAPFMASFVKNVSLVVDMDDDEFTSPVFNFLAAGKLFAFICKTRNVIGIAASNRLVERMREYVDTVFYVPTVADTKRFYPELGEATKKEVIFCWSGIVFGPPVFENIEFVLEAFARLKAHCGNVKLKIAVRGPLLNLLEIKIKELYSDIPLELVEWIAPEDMRDFYVSADVGLNPLVRNDEFTLCKSPTKLFEYMACGMPSVTHRIGEAVHIVEDGQDGFLVADMEDFVKKMCLLADDKSLRKKMGERAYWKIKDKYCLKVTRNKLSEVFLAAKDMLKH